MSVKQCHNHSLRSISDSFGATDIEDLQDVNITTPSDGQVLTYDNTNSEWKNADATGGHTIKDSSGTSLTQRNTMQFKTPFSSADNSTSQTTEISLQKLSTGEMDDVVTPLPSSQVVAKDLDDLDDVDITTPSNGQVLAYNSTTNKWENTAGGSGGGGHTIEDASGTELTQRDVLKVSTPLTATDDSTNEETVLGVDSGIDFTGFTPPSSPSEGSNSHYCVCSTAASTIGKKATAFDGDFTIETGTKVYVAFTYKNSATSPTLQIGESEAIAIKGYGTTKPSSWWVGGDVVQFIYDGTNWIMQPTQGQINSLSSALTDTDSRVAANTFGSPVDLSSYSSSSNLYTFPSDGYLDNPSGTSYVYGATSSGTDPSVTVSAGGALFVKKGMKCFVQGTSTRRFFPIS